VHAVKYTPDEEPCGSEACRVAMQGHEMGVAKLVTAWKAALKTVFVYTHASSIEIMYRMLKDHNMRQYMEVWFWRR
jgi:hypothetical protein